MPIGSERIAEGLLLGYDDGSTGVEVVHKATSGFVHTVTVAIDGAAYAAGGNMSIRDGTGNVVWNLPIAALGGALVSAGASVVFDALFLTDIRTLITVGAGTMTVSYQ